MQSFTFCLCRAAVSHARAENEGENTEERGKKLAQLFVHMPCVRRTGWCTCCTTLWRWDTHANTYARTHIRPTCCISGPRLSLFAFVAPWSLLRCSSSSVFFNLWPSFCVCPPPLSSLFSQAYRLHTHTKTHTHIYTHMGLGARLVKVCDGKRVQRVHAHVCVCMSATMKEGNCVGGGRGGTERLWQ